MAADASPRPGLAMLAPHWRPRGGGGATKGARNGPAGTVRNAGALALAQRMPRGAWRGVVQPSDGGAPSDCFDWALPCRRAHAACRLRG